MTAQERVDFHTVEWTGDGVRLLDQRRLPQEEVYLACSDYRDVAQAIRTMVVRGAPAIGITAAMGIALGARSIPATTFEEFYRAFEQICQEFASTRPTAVNLFWAITRMRNLVLAHRDTDLSLLKQRLVEEAQRILAEDIAINKQIGEHGKSLLADESTVLTHCNAGALATGGYGTALGVIRAAWEAGKKIMVLADETRPFLQGARLTAWELHALRIPVKVITDSMAGYFMRKKMVQAVLVGADRIAANGDVANKIGTYTLAVLAKEHDIPFYVAAPTSTIDLSISTGDDIPIEERNPQEVTHWGGQPIVPPGVEAANPAFDITPHSYIRAIITEKGILSPPLDENIARVMSDRKVLSAEMRP
ncbi:MAG: S-methyl-5-thioribose-1-phosphate isomerase [Nitrospinota bacterium]|nr:MAG: S-methyl-5-thioribose-1-phosphate isomerase [Nitrospinota bacterium]